MALMLLIAIYVFFERLIAIKHATRIDPNFMNIIRDHIVSGNVTAARSFAKPWPFTSGFGSSLQQITRPIFFSMSRSEQGGCLP